MGMLYIDTWGVAGEGGRDLNGPLRCIFQCHFVFEMPSLLQQSKLAFQGPGVSLWEAVGSSVIPLALTQASYRSAASPPCVR